jgi:arylsulfatase A-like enzyme
MMVAVDDALGVILQKLEEMNQLDHTVIFFFNDHGQAGKSTIYETGAKCPSLVWRSSGFSVGNETEALVSNIDFAPTIMDLAGTELSYRADGVSIIPLLEGKTDAVRESAYFELGFSRGVRKGPWKYIALRYPANAVGIGLCYKSQEGIRSHFGHLGTLNQKRVERLYDMVKRVERKYPHYYEPDQLYNLENDPNEQVNLASDPEYAAILSEMKQELKNCISTVSGTFGEFKSN